MTGPARRRRRKVNDEIAPEIWNSWSDDQRKTYRQQKALATSLSDTKLSVRVINALEKAGIFTVGDLIKQTNQSLLGLGNFGDKMLDEVKSTLRSLGLKPLKRQ